MGKIRGTFFRDVQGFKRLDAGSRAGFTSFRPSPPWTLVFQFLFYFFMYNIEKLGAFLSKLIGA